jgi:DNA-binding transcriptional MerR regulator
VTDTVVEEKADGLSAAHVCALAGITYRNLDYWLRRGFIDLDPEHPDPTGRGSGYPRRFTPQEADRFVLLARLVRAGFRVETAADVARKVARAPGDRVEVVGGIWVQVT